MKKETFFVNEINALFDILHIWRKQIMQIVNNTLCKVSNVKYMTNNTNLYIRKVKLI